MLLPYFAHAQKITTEDYIETYKDIAIREMRSYKIPASITLAQGILESASGNSLLAREANNHFGIKCHKGWDGDTYFMDDDEKNECFRKYDCPESSFIDHSVFLTTRSRYAALFDLDICDYKGWAKGLKAAGYATNPQYAQILIKKIEDYDLTRYDQMALGLLVDEESVVEVTEDPGEEIVEKQLLAYSPLDKSVYDLADMTASGRFVYKNNGVKFVFAKDGDTPEALAKELGIYAYQLFDYNLFPRRSEVVFRSGDVVYIEPLKRKCKHPVAYMVQEDETLRDVALRFAVRQDKLQKYNGLKGIRIKSGAVVKLKR